MGSAERKFESACIEFNQKWLKKPMGHVAKLMPVGFTDEDFVSKFRQCFAVNWLRLEIHCSNYHRRANDRKKNHQEPIYNCPTPDVYLLNYAKHLLNRLRREHAEGVVLSQVERNDLEWKLQETSDVKLKDYQEKDLGRMRLRQSSTPSYIGYYTRIYYQHRKLHPDDINTRYIILHEAAMYRCDNSVRLLHQVSQCERNHSLRKYAFKALQEMGIQDAKLGPKRTG